MPSFNKVFLMGHLTRDPELTYTPSQMAVCKFGLAVNRKYKDKEDVLFIDCTAFDKTGETIQQHLTKGKPIFIEGTLKLDQWDDKATGQKRSKIYVIANQFQFVGGRDDAVGGEAPAHAPARGRPAAKEPVAPFEPSQQPFKDDDIPF